MPRITKTCPICGKQFESLSSPSRNQIYCSRECAYKSPKHQIPRRIPLDKRICPYCGKEFEIEWHKPKRFCSIKCGLRYNAENRSRAVDRKDTRVLSQQTHRRYERKTKDGRRVRMHRLVMEEKLGRQLESHEIVHHIDCDTGNNSIDNLHLFAIKSEHMRAHHQLDELVQPLLARGIVEFSHGKYRLSGAAVKIGDC